jgi:acyl-CoA reductase-like NAD-dependent aldehyde dehydrogenase
VWKPSPYASAVTISAVRRLAGLPAGVLNLVLGGGEVAFALARSQLAGFQFVGTSAAAQWLCTEALQTGARVAADVAAPGLAVVLEDADLDVAAAEIVASACSLAGQRSGAIRFVLAESRTAPALARSLCNAMAAVTPGDPATDAGAIGPMISKDAARQFIDGVAAACAAGAECLAGAELVSELGETFVEATLLIGQRPVSDPGPVVVLAEAEHIGPHAGLASAVCASIFGGDNDRAEVTAACLAALVVRHDASPPKEVFETLFAPREPVYGTRLMRSPLIQHREEQQ